MRFDYILYHKRGNVKLFLQKKCDYMEICNISPNIVYYIHGNNQPVILNKTR